MPKVIVDKNMNIKNITLAICQLVGYTREELIGKKVNILMNDNVSNKHDSLVENYYKTGISEIFSASGRRVKIKHKDGRMIDVIIFLNKYFDNGELTFIGSIHKVEDFDSMNLIESNESNKVLQAINKIFHLHTSRKYTIDEIRQFFLDETVKLSGSMTGYYSQIIHNNSSSIKGFQLLSFTSDIKNYCDPEFLKQYPIDKESNKNYFFPFGDNIYSMPMISKIPTIINTFKDLSVEDVCQCPFKPNGKPMENFLTFPILYEEVPLSVIGISGRKGGYDKNIVDMLKPLISSFSCIEIENITRMELLKEKKEKVEINESVGKIKSSFVANISHELRTPLNGLLGMLNILKDTEMTTIQYDYLNICNKSANDLINIIDDVLLYSKADAGGIELETIPFDFNSFIEDIVFMASTNLKKSQTTELVYIIDNNVPNFLIGDPTRLKQIILNLINNAIKFTPKGEIKLNISLQTDNKKDIVLLFSIKDTGIGISEEQGKRIFKSFSQADTTISRKFGGTGLGLVICSMLVELFSGKIWYDSIEGEGSCFYFTAKFYKDPSMDTIDPFYLKNKEKEILKDKRILIVDDNETNCLLLFNLMSAYCRYVNFRTSGKECIKLLQETKEPFDILLLDYHMPELDGISVSRTIYEKNIPIKIIMLSSVHEKKVLTENILMYTTKPIRKKQLLYMLCHSILNENIDPKILNKNTASLSESQRNKNLSRSILVVEDNEINRQVITKMLEDKGFVTDEAGNGIEAVTKIDDKKEYQSILMDIHMPIMDGIEATKIIRQKKIQIPIIALTADISEETKLSCFEVGMDCYVCKPYDFENLYKIINDIIDRKGIVKNLLLADDNETNRLIFISMVNKINPNIKIDACENGNELIEKYKKAKDDYYNIIFLDINMPELNGYETARAVKSIKKNAPPIIAITGYDNVKLDNMFVASMLKPITPDKLEKILIKYNSFTTKIEDVQIELNKHEIINDTMLNSITGSNKDIMKMLFAKYLSITDAEINEMIILKDYKEIKDKAHSIKGSSYQIGANKMGFIAQTIEQKLKSDEQDIQSDIQTLKDVFQMTKAAFDKMFLSFETNNPSH